MSVPGLICCPTVTVLVIQDRNDGEYLILPGALN